MVENPRKCNIESLTAHLKVNVPLMITLDTTNLRDVQLLNAQVIDILHMYDIFGSYLNL